MAHPWKWHAPPAGAVIFNDLPKTPKGKLLWTCSRCKKTSVWRDGWMTYGSYAQQDDGYCLRVLCPECGTDKTAEDA